MPDGAEPTFAEIGRMLRVALGFAQEDLAAHLQVSRKTVQRWERGLGVPDQHSETLLAGLCAQRRVFPSARLELGAIGVSGWDDVAAALSRARALRPRRGRPVFEEQVLIGRAEEIATVEAWLARERFVTIIGTGGVGKTSVAWAVADRWAQPVVTVELAQVTAADTVLDAIAARLPEPIDPVGSTRGGVVAGLGTTDLLVLDNLEHLPAAAPVVADIVASCPHLHVLATSRGPLGLGNERVFPLRPLSLDGPRPDAQTLFARRAREATGRDLPGDASTQASVERICRALDGIPLAIELVANRLRAVSAPDLAERLDRPLGIVSGGGADRPDRHRSLRACIEWSHQLLSRDAADLLVGLGPFVGGWTLRAAEQLAGGSAVGSTADLVDAGLVRRDGRRYAMNEAVREFVTANDAGATARFIEWAIEHARSLEVAARGPDADALVSGFDDEAANLRAALGSCLANADASAASSLCLALTSAWDARSMLREACRWIERTIALQPDEFSTAALRTWLGYFVALQGDFTTAARHANESLNTWQHHGIDAGIGYACLILGRCAAESGRLDDADQLLQRSEAAMRTAGDEWGLVRPVNALGELARERGDLRRAHAQHLNAAELCRSLGDLGSLPSILADLANVAADLGDRTAARTYADEALTIATQRGNPAGIASALDALGRAQLLAGDPTAALDSWTESDDLRADIHHPVERRDRPALEHDRLRALEQLQVGPAPRTGPGANPQGNGPIAG